jgi:hypothetical protein
MQKKRKKRMSEKKRESIWERLPSELRTHSLSFLPRQDFVSFCESSQRLNQECWKNGIYKLLLTTPEIWSFTLGQIRKASEDKRWDIPILLFGADTKLNDVSYELLRGFKRIMEEKDQKAALGRFLTGIRTTVNLIADRATDEKEQLAQHAYTDDRQRQGAEKAANAYIGVDKVDQVSFRGWKDFFNLMKELVKNPGVVSSDLDSLLQEEEVLDESLQNYLTTQGQISQEMLNKLREAQRRQREEKRQAALVLQRRAMNKWAYDPKIQKLLASFV